MDAVNTETVRIVYGLAAARRCGVIRAEFNADNDIVLTHDDGRTEVVQVPAAVWNVVDERFEAVA